MFLSLTEEALSSVQSVSFLSARAPVTGPRAPKHARGTSNTAATRPQRLSDGALSFPRTRSPGSGPGLMSWHNLYMITLLQAPRRPHLHTRSVTSAATWDTGTRPGPGSAWRRPPPHTQTHKGPVKDGWRTAVNAQVGCHQESSDSEKLSCVWQTLPRRRRRQHKDGRTADKSATFDL